MRILFITNRSMERCGVRVFGDLMIAALERAGLDVDVWDGCYSTVVEHGYLPRDLYRYDLVHLNWDPQAINHYLPCHFAGAPPLSLFLHDVPPNSTCPVFDQARWRFGFEPWQGVDVFEEPVPPTPPLLPSPYDVPDGPIVIGATGIRDDPGMHAIEAVCRHNGWVFNGPVWRTSAGVGAAPANWLSTDDEIRRLAQSTVNVCWYHTSGRGKSMAAMFCCAAKRPLILSGSSMFSALWPYPHEVYSYRDFEQATLEAGLQAVVRQVQAGTALRPDTVCWRLGWDRQIRQILRAWEEGYRG